MIILISVYFEKGCSGLFQTGIEGRVNMSEVAGVDVKGNRNETDKVEMKIGLKLNFTKLNCKEETCEQIFLVGRNCVGWL